MKKNKIHSLSTAAMLFAVGLVLPFLVGQIPQIGSMLCPMHIPVLLCGLILGWKYGLAVGFLLPLVRSLLFGMPAIFPNAVSMAFELAAYGAVAGFVYFKKQYFCLRSCYVALITAMIAGRAVWGLTRYVLLAFGVPFTFEIFMTAAFLNAIPGIIVQLILIPLIMVALGKTGLVQFDKVPA